MNISHFSNLLKNVLWSDQALTLIPHFGWNDGGCRSLMKAFILWFDSKDVIPHQIVVTPGQYHSEHVFVRIGDWFLDGDGVSTFDEMVDRWRFEEGLPSVFVRKFDPKIEPNAINGDQPLYISNESIHKLVQILDSEFNKEFILNMLQTTRRT